MTTTMTIPIGQPGEPRTGTLTFRDVAAGPVTAAVADDGFAIAALVVMDIVRDADGEDYVEVARTRGESIEVAAGQLVVVQVELTSGAADRTVLRVAGHEVEVLAGHVETRTLVSRPVAAPGRTIELPVAITTRGGESTAITYELAEPVPGITMVPQTVAGFAGTVTRTELVLHVTAPMALGAVTVRLLATAFGGMQREVLAPITLLVRHHARRSSGVRMVAAAAARSVRRRPRPV